MVEEIYMPMRSNLILDQQLRSATSVE